MYRLTIAHGPSGWSIEQDCSSVAACVEAAATRCQSLAASGIDAEALQALRSMLERISLDLEGLSLRPGDGLELDIERIDTEGGT